MRFLIKMAVWFSLVLLLLPFKFGDESDTTASIGPLQTFFAAKQAVDDLSGICERKPDVCVTGRAALETIAVRARESARLAIDVIEAEDQPVPPRTPRALVQPTQEASATQVAPALPVPVLETGSIPIPTRRPADAPRL